MAPAVSANVFTAGRNMAAPATDPAMNSRRLIATHVSLQDRYLTRRLRAVGCKAEVLAKEWHHVILEPVGYCAGMGTRINLEAIVQFVAVEDLMQLSCVHAQVVLIADIHG